MQDGSGKTDPVVPIPEVKPIQVTNADEIFKEAAKHLRYETPEGEKAPGEVPPLKPPVKEKKVKAAPEPKPEPTPEPEPKKSKRELFREAADAERAYREKEGKLKEREAKLQAIEERFKDFQADPISYLEKLNPRAYEEWTHRNIQDGKNPETQKISALEQKIEELTKLISGTKETTQQEIMQARYSTYMSEAKSILQAEDFSPVRQSIELFEEFSGRPVDVEQAIAGIWTEYQQQYGKHLTPREACEILLEDAQSHLDKLSKAEKIRKHISAVPSTPTPKQKRIPPTSGNTITSAHEQAGAPAREINLSGIKDKDQLLAEAAKLLEYEQPADE